MQSNSSWPAVSQSISLMSSPFKLRQQYQVRLLLAGPRDNWDRPTHSRDARSLVITSSIELSTHHIRFSRKSTPMVFLYSAVKIPLQYFWIIEDLPTAPLPTMTTWREFSKIIEMKHRESIYIWGNLGCERCWILRLLTWIVLYVWICWIHQKPFELSLAW